MSNQKSPLAVVQSEETWYKGGLSFRCTGCGKCCTGSPGYVWITHEEVVALAEHLHCSLADFAKKYLRVVNGRYCLKERMPDYDCIFLSDNKCMVYDFRPKQCRTFPWWVQNLQTPQDWQMAARRCEGINHPDAPLVSSDEIVKHLQSGDGIVT